MQNSSSKQKTRRQKQLKTAKADITIIDTKTDTQIQMQLDEPLSNKYYKVKGKFYFISKYLEIKSYFRNPWVWCFIILTITTIVIQAYYLKTNLDTLPDKIPLLTMYHNLERRLFDKAYLITLPVTSGLLLLVSIITGTRVFYTNKLLSIFTLLLCLIASSVLTYALVKIISFYYV